MLRSDVFIFLDDAQMQKKGGSWINRVQIPIDGKATWLTLPVDRAFHGFRSINQVNILERTPWRIKLRKCFQSTYGRAVHFDEVFPVICDFLDKPADNLATFNENIVRGIWGEIGSGETEIIRASSFSLESKSTERLVELVRLVGGTRYLCGGGASGYQEDEKFTRGGIDVVYQDFKHPVYVQINTPEFIPGQSILDPLMNLGWDGTRELIRS